MIGLSNENKLLLAKLARYDRSFQRKHGKSLAEHTKKRTKLYTDMFKDLEGRMNYAQRSVLFEMAFPHFDYPGKEKNSCFIISGSKAGMGLPPAGGGFIPRRLSTTGPAVWPIPVGRPPMKGIDPKTPQAIPKGTQRKGTR